MLRMFAAFGAGLLALSATGLAVTELAKPPTSSIQAAASVAAPSPSSAPIVARTTPRPVARAHEHEPHEARERQAAPDKGARHDRD